MGSDFKFYFLQEEDKYYMSEEDFQLENMITLYEDMFNTGGNATSLKKIDGYFDELISLIDDEEGLIRVRTEADKLLRKISTIINKTFNIDIIFTIDYNRQYPQNIAYTYYSKEVMKVLDSEIAEIIIEKDFGYHFIKPKIVNITFENEGLRFLKYPNLSKRNQNKGREFPEKVGEFEGRHLTEILLHELGHNIFLPFHFSQSNDRNYELKVGDNKPIIVYPYQYHSEKTVLQIISAILMSILTLGSTSLIDMYSKEYLRGESNANALAFQYGYGKEILENTIRIKWICDINRPTTMIEKLKKLFRKKNIDTSEYQSTITRDTLNMIDAEIKNPNNSKEQIKFLKDLRQDYVERIRDIQAEIDIHPEIRDRYKDLD